MRGEKMKKKTMVEFFCGSKKLAKAFQKKGYDVYTVDNNFDLNPDIMFNKIKVLQ